MAKMYYINGMLTNHARKICKFYFGDFLESVDLNEKNRTFDIYLFEEIEIDKKIIKIKDTIDIDYFREFWGPQWRLLYKTVLKEPV